MTENGVLFFLIILCITVIPLSLCLYLAIRSYTDEVINRCNEIGAWAKRELEKMKSDENYGADIREDE